MKIIILKTLISGEDGAATIAELMRNKVHFHKPGENFKTDGYVIDDTTMDRHVKLFRNLKKVSSDFLPFDKFFEFPYLFISVSDNFH